MYGCKISGVLIQRAANVSSACEIMRPECRLKKARNAIRQVARCSGRRALIRCIRVMRETHGANERDGVLELLKNADYAIRLLHPDCHFPL